MPAKFREISNSCTAHRDPLRPEQFAFHRLVAAVAAEPSGCGDHAVTRHVRRGTVAHDRANSTCRPRPAGERGDVAVGRHATWRDPTHGGENATRELRSSRHSHSTPTADHA